MAKGLAVISGSNTIVFKALENGVVQMGGQNASGTLKPAQVTVSGSFIVSGSEGALFNVSGSGISFSAPSEDGIKILSGLASDATSSLDHDFVMIKSDGSLLKSSKIDASAVMLDSGQSVQDLSASIDQRIGTSQLTVKDTDGDEATVSLTEGSLTLNGVANKTVVNVTQDSAGVASYEVTLDENIEVTSVSASSDIQAGGNLTVAGDADLNGNADIAGTLAVGGNATLSAELSVVGAASLGSTLGVAGDATFQSNVTVDALLSASSADVAGNLIVRGDLQVIGDTVVTTKNQSNLIIEDAIILVGSGSDADTDDLALLFGTANSQALAIKGGEFYLGASSDDAQDAAIAVTADATLNLGTLKASDVQASTLSVSTSAAINALTVSGDAYFQQALHVSGNVTLGSDSSDVVTVNAQLTASAGLQATGLIEAQAGLSASAADIGGATNINGKLTVNGDVELNSGRFSVPRLDRDQAKTLFGDVNGNVPDYDLTWEGYMFYLADDDAANDMDAFPQGHKWYFNEGGYWHVSFFYIAP